MDDPPERRSGVSAPCHSPRASRFAEEGSPTAQPTQVHFAFSKSLFADVNENDAKAAVKVYAQVLGGEHGVSTGDGPVILAGTNAIAEALRHQQVDLLSVTAEEFIALEGLGLEGPLLVTSVNQSITEEFVLLARADGPIRNVEDLSGRSLIVFDAVRASLARLWLEVLCRERHLGPADQVLARITPGMKPTQVVLPVFFGKADACIVTRYGWEVMGELNPQVQKQLRVVAVSPPVVPAMTCFHRGLSETLRQRILEAAEGSSAKPSFKQLMALFKTEGLGRQPISSLQSTREFIARYHQLCAGGSPSTAANRKAGASVHAAAGKKDR